MVAQKQQHHRRRGVDVVVVNVVGYALIGLFALACVIPFYLIIIASFTSDSTLIREGYPLFLKELSLERGRGDRQSRDNCNPQVVL